MKPKQECSLDKAEIHPLEPNADVVGSTIPSDSNSSSAYLAVLHEIRQDILSCDLLWSFFISALLSYRRDTVLRPFPQKYCDPGNDALLPDASGFKNFERLKTAASQVPDLTFLLNNKESDVSYLNSCEDIKLLSWTLNTKSFSIRSVDKGVFIKIKEITHQVADAPTPTHIFEINYNKVTDSKFHNKELIYAYHGSRVENFHSILHNGLCNHMNKNSLFGEGTYLSSDLSVCMPYSPTGLGWSKSLLGDKIGCVAVCEIINHPDVKCRTKKPKKTNGTPGIRPGDILADGIPEKYYIVQNDELVRIKYLLVYANNFNSSSRRRNMDPQPKNWLLEHKFIIMMIAYLLVLLAVGFGDSRTFKSVFQKLTTWFK